MGSLNSLKKDVSSRLNLFKTSGIYQTKKQNCDNNTSGGSCNFTDPTNSNLKKLIAESKSSCKNIKNLEDKLHKSQHNKFLHDTGICSVVKNGKHQWGQINQTLFGPVCKTGNQKQEPPSSKNISPTLPKIPNGYSECLTDWKTYCSDKGSNYVISDKEKCATGFNIKCKQIDHKLENNDFMTPCLPSTHDFDYECSQTGWDKNKNNNYGYQKLFFGEEGLCMKDDKITPDNTKASAKCSRKYRRGVNIFGEYNQLTSCLPENNDFEKECQLLSNNKSHADVIGGFDCIPGRQRAVCKIKTSNPRLGDTKEKKCRHFCSQK